jgi:hypothetical protein
MKQLLRLIAATIAVLAATAHPVGAAVPPSGTLWDPNRQVVTWDGGVQNPVIPGAYQGLLPEACAVTSCDEFHLNVALPPNVWSNPDDGVQIAIRWPADASGGKYQFDGSEDKNQFQLYVYGPPDGQLVAKSPGTIASDAMSVRIKNAQNGDYRVVAVLIDWYTATPPQYYGRVEVERAPAIQPVRDLLPNLVPLATVDVQFRAGYYYGDFETWFTWLGIDDPLYADNCPSCYPDEMAPVDVVQAQEDGSIITVTEPGARRCLRFDQTIANLGDGPMELRYKLESTGGYTLGETSVDPQDQEVHQRIYRSDGTFRENKTAESYVFHPTHAHFHYENMAQSSLWAADPKGKKLGDKPVRVSKHTGHPRDGKKTSFCLADIKNVWFDRKGDDAKRFSFPESCNVPSDQDASGHYLVNGVSVGWADRYPWYLASGYVEVSGLPEGYYVLHTVVDPDKSLLETNKNDNTIDVLIYMCTVDGHDQADIVGKTSRCHPPATPTPTPILP